MKLIKGKRALFLGADLGGSNLRMALVGPRGKVLARAREDTSRDRSIEGILDRVVTLACQLRAEAASIGGYIAAVGLGVPGLVTPSAGIVVTSPNFPGWKQVPLKGELEARLQVPVCVENDVNANAVGELLFGAAQGANDVLVVTLGTGVGGGLILGGRLRRGPDGTAAEIGHVTVNPRGRLCGCGNRGCLECYASATAITARAVEAELLSETEASAERLAFLARERNGEARAIFAEAGRCLGIVFASVTNLLNLEVIVIGGGVSRAWDLMESATWAEIYKRAFSRPVQRLRISATCLFDDAGVLGATYLARRSRTGSESTG